MGIMTLFFLALGLAMDALAVSISNGMCYRGCGKRQTVIAAATFGIFQAVMPVLGYEGGRMFSQAISSLDHWIALILLGAIGGNMVWEALRELGADSDSDNRERRQLFSLRILLLQGVATSIDALAVGVSFALMRTNIAIASVTIGVVTFGCCLLGGILGSRFGLILGQKARLFGGLVLMAIGLKIFAEHMLGA